METVVTVLALLAVGGILWFAFSKLTAKKAPTTKTGGSGGKIGDDNIHQNLK